LSSRPFVLVGQASYSFYLWHFPIFAYATYLIAGPLSVGEGLLLSAVSLSLAFASLYLFENPVRHARTKIAWVTPLALIAVMGAVGFSLASSNGLPRRLGDRSASFVATSHDETRHHSDCMTNTTIVPPDRACVLGDSASVPHTLLWGDSHAMIVATAMEAAAKKEGKSFKFAASADCPQGLGLAISDQTQPSLTRLISYRYCGKYNRKMFDLAVSDPNIRNIVFAARWTNWRIGEPGNKDETPVDIRLEWNGVVARSEFENRRIWESSFLDLVRALRAKGKQIYIVGPVPEPPFNVPQRFYVAQFGLVSQPEPLPIEDFYSRHRVILDFFSRLEKAKDIHFIWPHKKLCHDNLCDLEEGGHLLYFDDNHLSVYGALQTAPLYDKLFMSTGS
jgi:hypothetical protein